MSEGFKGMQWEYNKTNFDRNLAVVIGIDRYKNDSIHDLSTPVSDAGALADLLETEYEYKPPKGKIIRLFDKAATLTGLQTLLTDTLPNQLNPTKGDRLIFYFAGHGIPRNGKDGPAGYLVPQDADLQEACSFLPMSEVHEALIQLECHHLLVILDCCFAGTFRWAGSRKMIPILETVRREHYDRFIRFPAWQVITSSAYNQEALDVALDNVVLATDKRGTVDNSSHSPFALALLEGLRNNQADVIKDDVVTAHELYLYLEQRVSQLSKERQNPGLYPLRRDYDRGEFIFTKPGFTRDQLKPAPPLDENNNPYRGLKSFDEKHSRFFFGRQALIEGLVKRLLLSNQALTVVLGVSGSGKSSLVKAGLIPYLRKEQEKQWYILDPMRPGELPFRSLARVILPVVNASLIKQLSQLSCLDEALKQVLKSRTEPERDVASAAQAKQEGDSVTSRLCQGQLDADETLIKVAQSWCCATPEAKLLLVEDYFAQLEPLCREEERQPLLHLHEKILAALNALSQHLQQEPHYLVRVIKTWSQNHPNVKLLLVIDQFEELITMSHDTQAESRGSDRAGGDSRSKTLDKGTTDTKQWQPFLETLRRAIAACPGQWRVVVTLRSDFEPRFLESPLESYWKEARFPVRAMNSDELRQAIEGPALKQALYFEPPELVGKLVDEVGQMPGALPLLSFTLSELYIKLNQRWRNDPNSSDRALREQDYTELGGVAGALTRRATQEYESEQLDDLQRTTMRRVMLRMVTIEGGGVARRRVLESELVYPNSEENQRVAKVIDRLVNARLLVKGQEKGEPYVEPAHDILVRGWDKLQKWIEAEQANLALQQRLTPAATDWDKDHQDPESEYLWIRDPRLALLEKVLESKENNWLNQLETKFVKSSLRKRQDELEETKKQLRISEERRVNAELREKAARGQNLLPFQPSDALALAIEAMGLNLDQLPEEALSSVENLAKHPGKILGVVQASLNEAMTRARVPNTLRGHENSVTSVAFSPDGKTIVSGSYDNTLRLWRGSWRVWLQVCFNRLAYHLISENPEINVTQSTCAACVKHKIWSGTDLGKILMRQGNDLARQEKVEEAVAKFQQALEYDPSLDLNPQAEAQRLVVPYLIEKSRRLVREGKVEDAITAYTQAQTFAPTLEISAESWNYLCWFGSLHGQAANPNVMAACEKAVELEPENGGWRDSRGLTRALTGNIEGAIEDFQAYIASTNNEERKLQRQRWIDALRARENPFTPEEIETLWGQ